MVRQLPILVNKDSLWSLSMFSASCDPTLLTEPVAKEESEEVREFSCSTSIGETI
jgi:hypothetical protein